MADSNKAAVALIDQWPNWPSHAAAVVGPKGSGKSHLAQVWQMRSGATSVAAQDLVAEDLPGLFVSNALVVEDLDLTLVSETTLFHLFNLARQSAGFVLLTAVSWKLAAVKLPDLLTRLSAVPAARILDPDDDLLRGVLVKLFADRQIAVDEGLISYLVTRMPRSLDAARQIVARIDAAALEQGVEVTRSFAGRILTELESPQLL